MFRIKGANLAMNELLVEADASQDGGEKHPLTLPKTRFQIMTFNFSVPGKIALGKISERTEDNEDSNEAFCFEEQTRVSSSRFRLRSPHYQPIKFLESTRGANALPFRGTLPAQHAR